MIDPVAAPWERGLRAAALGGDAAAWRVLYDSAFDTVASYAHWRCGREDLAEEVVQETWLTAARRLASFKPEQARFAAWVCGIAANIAKSHIRKRSRESRRVRTLVTVPEPATPDESSDSERVALALADLTERYEAVLRAKYFERQSVAEIAAANGETEKTVESLLSRARQAFRVAFERFGDTP